MKSLSLIMSILLLACSTPSAQKEKSVASDLPPDGPHVEIYDNGQTMLEGQYKDGQRTGNWVSYYQSGLKWSEEEYRKGEKNGVTVSYYPTGIVRYRGMFRNNEKTGKWYFYDEEGKVIKEVEFD